jgi:outer membrane protein assembly factor BamB
LTSIPLSLSFQFLTNSRNFSHVIALDMGGNMLWTSLRLEGVAAGSPVVSDDGNYVFLTHNADLKSKGYFSALWAASSGTTFYSMSNETAPFAPLGIFHNPVEGFYDGGNGLGNTNDIIMWANAVNPVATSISKGSTFVFQFPVGFADDPQDGVGYLLLGDIQRDFLVETAPVITNQGRSVYYSASRSNFVCWVGEDLLPREYFSRFPREVAADFDRNLDFAGEPVFASPALSSDSAQPTIFGGSAHTQFVRLDYDFSNTRSVLTNSHIMAEAKVDPGDRTVYFVESAGLLHSVDFDNIQDIWTYDVGFTVEADMAMSKDGSILYIGDARGMITAVQVTEIAPTPAPTSNPTATASESPSSAPSVPTDSPTATPTGSPSASPTGSPSATPTGSPIAPLPTSEAPVADPTTEAPAMADTDDSAASRASLLASIALVAACLLI